MIWCRQVYRRPKLLLGIPSRGPFYVESQTGIQNEAMDYYTHIRTQLLGDRMERLEASEAHRRECSVFGHASRSTSAMKPSPRRNKSAPVKSVRVSTTVNYADVDIFFTSHLAKASHVAKAASKGCAKFTKSFWTKGSLKEPCDGLVVE